MFGKSKMEQQIQSSVESIVRSALNEANSALALAGTVQELRKEVETLETEKARRTEEFATREREIEHKVGLERKRQEFELGAAKREATLAVREENLAADRKRFEDQMSFHEKRFTEEVTYLKEMMGQVMERLPNVNVEAMLDRKRK